MIGAITRVRQRRNAGFTLIELLVVIVILGILSGVVVFAVRGSGDKGEANARATDKRIVRTAMETFCARYGRYAQDMDELVHGPRASDGSGARLGKGFLSEASTYNFDVVGIEDGGPCNGWSYSVGDGSGGPDSECGEPQAWCATNGPPAELLDGNERRPNRLIQVASGKVLVFSFTKSFLYDPVSEKWADGRDIPAHTIGAWPDPPAVLLTDNPATPQNDCAAGTINNCNKVLTMIEGTTHSPWTPSKWVVYDPEAPEGTAAWTELPGPYRDRYGFRTSAIQIYGTNCGSNCGKVLIIGQSESTGTVPQPPIAEVFDPGTNQFTVVGSHAPAFGRNPGLALLKDGRVLMVDAGSVDGSLAKMFNPTLGVFSDVAPPGVNLNRNQNPLSVLPGDKILAIGLKPGITNQEITAAAIYEPGPVGTPGSWSPVTSCSDTAVGYNFDTGCYIVASLPDGSVLATKNERGRGSKSEGIFRFNPATKQWARTGDPTDGRFSPRFGILITGESCSPNCNKVLAIGSYEVYGEPPVYLGEIYTP